jgi:hypothetical protein
MRGSSVAARLVRRRIRPVRRRATRRSSRRPIRILSYSSFGVSILNILRGGPVKGDNERRRCGRMVITCYS